MKSSQTYMNIKTLETKTRINNNTLRLALDSYKLSKFVVCNRPITVVYSKKFINDLKQYFFKKGSFDKVEKLSKLK